MYILQIRCCSLWRPVVSSRCTNFWGHVLSPSYRIKNIDSAVPFETSLSVNYLTQNAEIYRKDLESYYCQWRRAGAQTFSWNPRTTPDVGFNTPFYGIFSTPPPLRCWKSTTSLCETWLNVSYISYCLQFIDAPSMQGNFFVFSVLYYNNLSSLLLTFAARTVSQSLVCLAWCTSHQDVYSNGAMTIIWVGEKRMCVHNKTVWCACEFMFI